MIRFFCAVLVFGLLLLPFMIVGSNDPDKFIDETLQKMGLEGHIGQMAQVDMSVLVEKDKSGLRQDLLDHYIGTLGVGSVLNNVVTWKISDYRKASIQIQETAKKVRPRRCWFLFVLNLLPFSYSNQAF